MKPETQEEEPLETVTVMEREGPHEPADQAASHSRWNHGRARMAGQTIGQAHKLAAAYIIPLKATHASSSPSRQMSLSAPNCVTLRMEAKTEECTHSYRVNRASAGH